MLQGVRDNFAIIDTTPYQRPPSNGFAADAAALRQDARQVAQDMRRAVDAYEQVNRSKR
jgi:hypothetical protein